jgi:hypothetical protein
MFPILRFKKWVCLLVYFYFTPALKYAPQAGHLYSPIVTGLLPFGASTQVFIGVLTSVPHFLHLTMDFTFTFYVIIIYGVDDEFKFFYV